MLTLGTALDANILINERIREEVQNGRSPVNALEAAGRRYRLAYRSSTQVGTHAPVMAGLAVTISTVSWVPEGLRAVRPDEGLPELPEFGILLLKAPEARQPVTDALAAHIEETFRLEAARAQRGAAA